MICILLFCSIRQFVCDSDFAFLHSYYGYANVDIQTFNYLLAFIQMSHLKRYYKRA